MNLTLENLDSLIERYIGEIQVLKEASDDALDDPALRAELDQAIKESEPMVAELRLARDLYLEIDASGRPMGSDEVQIFEYFGFTVDPQWLKQRAASSAAVPAAAAPAPAVPVAVAPPNPTAVAGATSPVGFEVPRPSDRRSSVGPGSQWEESETDPEAAAPQQYRPYRALTPEYDERDGMYGLAPSQPHQASVGRPSVAAVPLTTAVTPSRGASPAPLPPAPSNTVAPPLASPRYNDEDVEERARVIANRLVAEERARMQAEIAARPPILDEQAIRRAVAAEAQRKEEWAHEMVHAVTEECNAKLAQLEASLREARSDIVRAESEADRERRKAEDVASACHRLQAELASKTAELVEVTEARNREKSQLQRQMADVAQSQSSEARQQWIEFVNDRLIPLASARFEPTITSLRAELATLKGRLEKEVREIKEDCAATVEECRTVDSSGTTLAALEHAQAALRLSAQVSSAVRYVTSVPSGSIDSDALDAAVVEELNRLGLSAHIAVRRLGPHGDYFIDRRLQLRLMNGRVFVKRAGGQTNAYEPLTKYIVKLYSPLFMGAQTDDAFVAVLNATGQLSPQPDQRYSSSSPQRSGMHHSGAVLELSPMATAPAGRVGSAVSPQRQPLDDPSLHPAERIRRLQREQQLLADELAAQKQLLSQRQAASHPSATVPASASSTPNANRSAPAARTRAPQTSFQVSSLAHLNEDEVELLKKLALAKQIRDQRRQQQVSTRSR